ncbi:MAG: 3-oxoacyl-[acyl-carrier-protein] reductase FabG [Alphaproteobacteria bacterium MarineAlpha11_Bin1]|nr:MAG: 3-oxoacyl-[acyl-carrier-protein] reductase FabG [Alphaproteobacteria bacterium MarineAlpha11_Bin1]|tara:strand:- start:4523 stop:5275 length:753 start_codon:yes stop_codon:yes gene_type:complete
MREKQNILITGAGSGIGRAAALRMSQNMHIVAADWNEDSAATTVALIEAKGGSATTIHVDVSDRNSVSAMKTCIESTIGSVHAAFFAAGIFIRGVVGHIPEEEWDRMINIHVKGTFLCCQAVLPGMIAVGKGAIVNMSSDFAVMAVPGAAAYMTAKSAIYSLTKTIAIEFAPHGIRVNALGPGPIDTPILTSGRTPEEYEQARITLADKLPLGRLGQPDEIAAVLDFLLSDRSSYITGQIIHPNGGQLMW